MEVQQPVEKPYYKKKDKYVRIVVFLVLLQVVPINKGIETRHETSL